MLNPFFPGRQFLCSLPLNSKKAAHFCFLVSLSLCVFIFTLFKSHGYFLILLSKAFNLILAAFKALHLGTSLERGLRLPPKSCLQMIQQCDKSEIFPYFASIGRGKWNHGQLSMKFNFPKWWLHLAAMHGENMQYVVLRYYASQGLTSPLLIIQSSLSSFISCCAYLPNPTLPTPPQSHRKQAWVGEQWKI